jgi:organic radical activating enzyme
MRISENFYSVQGEGISTGVPAYFIRLQGCNLMCGGRDGQLVKENKASWWCDTEYVWKQGKEVSNEELVEKFHKAGQLENILDGFTHLIWTGGEPTLPESRRSIESFIDYADNRFEGNNMYHELETNGTISAGINFFGGYIQQINCSPKLANSGIEYNKRVNPIALKQINSIANSWFKFVVSNEEDIREITSTYQIPFNIPRSKIIIMPGVDNINDLPERTKFLYEMTKKHGYRGITRGHILAWNKTTGV